MPQRQTHNDKRPINNDFAYDLIPSFFTAPFGMHKKLSGGTTLGSQMHEEVIELEILREGKSSQTLLKDGLKDAIKKDSIEIFMQPVLTLPQRRTRFYEIYGRLRVASGKYAPASAYIDMADEQNILGKLDKLVLAQTMKLLKQQAENSSQLISYFLNIRPHVLRDQSFMNSFLKDLSRYKVFAHRLIFELPASTLNTLSKQEMRIIKALSQTGCRFSLDQVSELPTDIKRLKELNICFIKIDAKSLIKASASDDGFKRAQSAHQSLKVNNIELIVQHIENEKQLLECLDFDPAYGQGNLFGRPDFKSVYIAAPQKNFFSA